MNNILDELWYGNVLPFEQFDRGDPNTKKLMALLAQCKERVLTDMTDAEKEWLEKYIACRDELESESQRQAFSYGFCLGARLLAAVMHTQAGE